MLDYFSNDTETVLKKNEKKKKLYELLDKYGSVEEIEKNAIGADGYEYMFANTNNLIDEVLEERRMGRLPLPILKQDTLKIELSIKMNCPILGGQFIQRWFFVAGRAHSAIHGLKYLNLCSR